MVKAGLVLAVIPVLVALGVRSCTELGGGWVVDGMKLYAKRELVLSIRVNRLNWPVETSGELVLWLDVWRGMGSVLGVVGRNGTKSALDCEKWDKLAIFGI